MKNDTELVSVVVPTYNSEEYIEETIKSVLSQTYINFELIIVNDASEDRTLTIINKYKKNNDRIKIINLTKNAGVSNARNIGINNAVGKYIVFIDADDLISQNFLEELIKYNNDENIIPRAFNFSENQKYDKKTYLMDIASGKCFGTCCGYLIDREKCCDIFFNDKISHMEDTEYITQIILKYDEVIEISNSIYTYVNNKDSATRKILEPNKMLKNYYNSIDLIFNRLKENNINLDEHIKNDRKFNILCNVLKQVKCKDVISIMNNIDNIVIMNKKNKIISFFYKSFVGKAYFIFRSYIKYKILKK